MDTSHARARPFGSPDSGMTVIELVVSMLVLSIVIGAATAAIASMADTTIATNGIADSSREVVNAMSMLDRQVRAATAVNVPGPRGSIAAGRIPAGSPSQDCAGSSDCFVEFSVPKEGVLDPNVCPLVSGAATSTTCLATDSVCLQWWVQLPSPSDPGLLLWRWWKNPTGTETVVRSAPIVGAVRMVPNENGAGAFQSRFYESAVYSRQRLAAEITSSQGGRSSVMRTVFTARNSESFYSQQQASAWASSACSSVDRNPPVVR